MKVEFKISNYPFKTKLATRWRDLDAFQHVNNAVFATYIENARVNLFIRWNLPFDGTGQSLIVASLKIDYYKQLKHPSNLIVGQRISRIGNTSFDIESAIFMEDYENEPLCVSKLVCVCYDFDKQKPTPIYKQILNDYKK